MKMFSNWEVFGFDQVQIFLDLSTVIAGRSNKVWYHYHTIFRDMTVVETISKAFEELEISNKISRCFRGWKIMIE